MVSLVSLFVRLWVEIPATTGRTWGIIVSLFVRLWVEILVVILWLHFQQVSLFVRLWVEMNYEYCQEQQAQSASSWGCELKYLSSDSNICPFAVSLFVRLWVEICPIQENIMSMIVSLFVRLWVEIILATSKKYSSPSASSWGCELKYDISNDTNLQALSASSWGCELKFRMEYILLLASWGQPLREAVSWNMNADEFSDMHDRQPLREAVSWNMPMPTVLQASLTSASSWGCELK